jgi:flagellar motor switch protein FliN/FliY
MSEEAKDIENVESAQAEEVKQEELTEKKTKKDGTGQVQSIDFILDIPLKLSVELGRTRMSIKDILGLSQGSVVELAKFAGEPLEVLVNDRLIARGEVVVVNEKFGVRLTDIISPVERIEQLK